MLNLIQPEESQMTEAEKVFYLKGFDCFPTAEKELNFRQFFMIQDLQPMLRAKLQRMNAHVHPEDMISLCYNGTQDVVGACVLKRDIYIEYTASSPEGRALMWGFGIEL